MGVLVIERLKLMYLGLMQLHRYTKKGQSSWLSIVMHTQTGGFVIVYNDGSYPAMASVLKCIASLQV